MTIYTDDTPAAHSLSVLSGFGSNTAHQISIFYTIPDYMRERI